jgi:hypothetical protein
MRMQSAAARAGALCWVSDATAASVISWRVLEHVRREFAQVVVGRLLFGDQLL